MPTADRRWRRWHVEGVCCCGYTSSVAARLGILHVHLQRTATGGDARAKRRKECMSCAMQLQVPTQFARPDSRLAPQHAAVGEACAAGWQRACPSSSLGESERLVHHTMTWHRKTYLAKVSIRSSPSAGLPVSRTACAVHVMRVHTTRPYACGLLMYARSALAAARCGPGQRAVELRERRERHLGRHYSSPDYARRGFRIDAQDPTCRQ